MHAMFVDQHNSSLTMERKDKILIGRLGLLELATASLPLMFTGTENSGNFGKLRLNPRPTSRLTKLEG